MDDIIINEVNNMFILLRKYLIILSKVSFCCRNHNLVRLETFPLEDSPPEQVAVLDRSPNSSPEHKNVNMDNFADNIKKYLPEWVELDMIFSEDSIERLNLLGNGNYGTIYKGKYHQGVSVYVI